MTRELITIEQEPQTVTISVDDGTTTTVIAEIPATDSVTIDVGTIGERGPPGASAQSVQVIFSSPSTSWHVLHNLGRKPRVSVLDAFNAEVIASVSHVSDNEFFVYFMNPQTGSIFYI